MRLCIACSIPRRLVGLLGGRACPGQSEVLLIAPCRSIHTFGMRVPIDVAFVDRDGCVCRTYLNLPPARFLSDRHACAVLERRTPEGLACVEGEVPAGPPGIRDGWFHVGERVVLGSEMPGLGGSPGGREEACGGFPEDEVTWSPEGPPT